MGLDVTAYSKLVFVTSDETAGLALLEGDEWDKYVHIYAADGFEERLDGKKEGYYRSEGEAFGFRAGGYISYSNWREWLANQIGASCWARNDGMWAEIHKPTLPPIRPIHPFWELLWFSDCEGAIGPETCKKLAKDFAEWESKIPFNDPRFQDFKKAFELASNGGFVDFH